MEKREKRKNPPNHHRTNTPDTKRGCQNPSCMAAEDDPIVKRFTGFGDNRRCEACYAFLRLKKRERPLNVVEAWRRREMEKPEKREKREHPPHHHRTNTPDNRRGCQNPSCMAAEDDPIVPRFKGFGDNRRCLACYAFFRRAKKERPLNVVQAWRRRAMEDLARV